MTDDEAEVGAALSIVYGNHTVIEPYQIILVVVCGGINTAFFGALQPQ